MTITTQTNCFTTVCQLITNTNVVHIDIKWSWRKFDFLYEVKFKIR